MKNKSILLGAVLMAVVSCTTQLNVSQVSPQKNQLINGEIAQKKELVSVITPYKKELENKMNPKISHTELELNRKGD
ncbi:MAG: bifunctional NAD pyrophosphatase/5'-nucleotidase, partial [Flavobacteriaceae bacterium]|nr:bifunctional NAD pyrophosphatase/5'-nucleotidase [Flavobacteriaceae bacterium]